MRLFSALVGGIIGVIGLSVLTLLFHGLFFRPALRDGQYVFVYYVTVPVGSLLGAITGLIVAYLSKGQAETVGRIAFFGGGILSVLFLLLGLFVFSGTKGPTLLERLSATLFWFGLPLLWSGALVRMGLRLLLGR